MNAHRKIERLGLTTDDAKEQQEALYTRHRHLTYDSMHSDAFGVVTANNDTSHECFRSAFHWLQFSISEIIFSNHTALVQFSALALLSLNNNNNNNNNNLWRPIS